MSGFAMTMPCVTAGSLVAILMLGMPSVSAVQFYVSPDGNDAHRGTLDEPVATLQRARDMARHWRQTRGEAGAQPITIFLREGLYEMPSVFELSPEDSGTAAAPVTIAAMPGEEPVLSGGRRIVGWTVGEDGFWRVTLPAVRQGDWTFHQLFVRREGQSFYERRYRPSRGLYVIAGLTDAPHRDAGGRVNHRNPQKEVFFHPGDIRPWDHLDDVELVFMHDWSSGRMHIEELDLENRIVRFREFPHYRIGHWYPGGRNPYLVENVHEFLGQAGDWYLDRSTGRLTYCPLPGERPDNTVVVAPRLETLVEATGDLTQDSYVEHLRFRGITFAHSAWHLPPHLYAERAGRACRQGFVDMPSAIEFQAARFCAVERCKLMNLGSYAVDLADGCHANRVAGNVMADLGTGGVKVGTVHRGAVPPQLPTGNLVENNVISDAGVIHYSGHGIWGGMCARTHIRHNVVTRTLYSSIAVGWSHSKVETGCRENVIEYNHVYDVMLLLDHGGAIYTLGNQPGTVIRGNVVHDTHQTRLHGSVARPVWAGGGLAFDDGSSSFVVEDNIIYDTAAPPDLPLRGGRSDAMTVRNNVCGIAPGDEGFPAVQAAKAGLEPDFRDLLEVSFRAIPPPVLFMDLPRDLKPAVIIDTFDRVPVGGRSSKAYSRLEDKAPGKGTDGIEVTDATAANGRHSLKISDAPGLSQPWIPYVSYNPAYDSGLAVAAFYLRLDPGADLEVVWRGHHPQKEFSVGPQLAVRERALLIGGERLMELPEATWIQLTMQARLGATDPGIGRAGLKNAGTWHLTVELPEGPKKVFENLAVPDEAFKDFKALMFISTATHATAFYLDDVRIHCE